MAIIKSGSSSDQWTIDVTSNAGRVSLYDTAGNAIDSELNVDGDHYLGMTMVQHVHASTLNSDTSLSLAGLATWGSSANKESTLGVAGIQVITFLTERCTVTVWQSVDGTAWDLSDHDTAPANFARGRTFQAQGSYYYVTVKNDSGSAATGYVGTALCPVVEALPRSLTSGGNLKVSPAADWQNQRTLAGLYTVTTFATLGTNSAPQNIFVLDNTSTLYSAAIRNLNVMTDSTAALATISPKFKSSRATTVSGGTVLTPVKYRTEFAGSNMVCRGGTNADGGGASAITATEGTAIWVQWMDRMYTAVSQHQHMVYSLIPDVGADLRQIIIAPGEALLVSGVTTAIPTTTQIIINCGWYEFLV